MGSSALSALLLTGAWALIQVRAGDCGSETAKWQEERGRRAGTAPRSRYSQSPCPTLPLLSLLSLACILSPDPCSPPVRLTSTGYGSRIRISPPSASRISFPAVFCHCRVPAWFGRAFLHLRRLRGDTQFLCYNNQGESQKMEPRALWVKQMGPEYWEQQTRTVKKIEKNSRVNLREAMGVYNHSEDGERFQGWDPGHDPSSSWMIPNSRVLRCEV